MKDVIGYLSEREPAEPEPHAKNGMNESKCENDYRYNLVSLQWNLDDSHSVQYLKNNQKKKYNSAPDRCRQTQNNRDFHFSTSYGFDVLAFSKYSSSKMTYMNTSYINYILEKRLESTRSGIILFSDAEKYCKQRCKHRLLRAFPAV